MSEQACLSGMPSEILLLIFSHLLHLNAPLTFKPTHCECPTDFIAFALVSERFYDLTSKVFHTESCFTIDVTPQKLAQLEQSSYPLDYLESDMLKLPGSRRMKHVEIISGEWLLFERFEGLIGNYRLFADAIASYVKVLMYRLHHSAPQLEKITFATRVPERYGARITQDLTLDAVSSVLPNVKELSIILRIDPLEEFGLKEPIIRATVLTFRKKVNGDWEKVFGLDPRRLQLLEAGIQIMADTLRWL